MKQRKKKLHKKGFWLDLPYVMVVLFAVGIVIFFVHKAYTEIQGDLIGSFDPEDNVTRAVLVTGQTVINGFDYLFVFFLVGIGVFLVASVFVLETNPIFFIITIMLMVILIIVASVLSEAFGEISNEEDMLNTSSTFTLTTFVMAKYPLFVLFYIIIGIIAFYAKSRLQ